MKKRLTAAMLLLSALWSLAGCDTSLTVGTKTVGIRSGEFIYSDGYLRTTYLFPFDRAWLACEKALENMKATDVDRIRRIAQGKFTAVIQDEKVAIQVDYVEREITAISVMVGSGNNLASQLVHERITAALKGP